MEFSWGEAVEAGLLQSGIASSGVPFWFWLIGVEGFVFSAGGTTWCVGSKRRAFITLCFDTVFSSRFSQMVTVCSLQPITLKTPVDLGGNFDFMLS